MHGTHEITQGLDEVYAELQVVLRRPDGVDKFARLSLLHEREAAYWRRMFESSQSRLGWLAAAAAGERARTLAEYWANRACHVPQLTADRPAVAGRWAA